MTLRPEATVLHQLTPIAPMPVRVTGTRQMFSPAEDQRLRSLVAQLGDTSWKDIARQMPNRTARQCRERYKNYLSPTVVNGPWTPQEDAALIEKVREHGVRWAKIAKYFRDRSDVNIKNRWKRLTGKQRPVNTARIDLPPNSGCLKPKMKLPPISSLEGAAQKPPDETHHEK